MSKIRVAVIGATGYTGLELIRILQFHPRVKIEKLISGSNKGKDISKIYPHLEKNVTGFITDDISTFDEIDLAFLALPHGRSYEFLNSLPGHIKVIDLSNDNRLNSEFVYGLPEFFASDVKASSRIANPGCFAICMQLGLIPIKDSLREAKIFGITGSSGSGKNPSQTTHHPYRNDNVFSYKINSHQHLEEVSMTLEILTNKISFVPTSGPFTRGIHLTIFPNTPNEDLKKVFVDAYRDKPFVRIKDTVNLKDVIGSNYCDISIIGEPGRYVVQAVIDNLIKGASGTAVQNMNLMFGFNETTGLNNLLTLYP